MSNWYQAIKDTHDVSSVILSVLAFLISIGSSALAIGSYRRAGASVRPFISTGAHITSGDMSLTLSNYGAGVAVITKILMARDGSKQLVSAVPLLSASSHYDVGGIHFVQDRYYVRPGDILVLATATPKDGEHDEALSDWGAALNGLHISVEYLDIYGGRFQYDRVLKLGTP